ncbi:MAG TPA: heavy-metal-associated domain-containing protein [Polyangia bacterium]|nr:heavy-metal-associated domain-containing protein [Polyangia bacterium]
MKKLIGSAILVLSLTAGGAAFAKDASTTFSVTGWHCGACSSKTEAALKKVKGVKKVDADTDKNTVTVAYDDSQTTVKALQDVIKSVGFEGKPVKN